MSTAFGQVERRFNSATAVIHNQYNHAQIVNDIALIKMSPPVTFSNRIKKICLPNDGDYFGPGSICYTVGWGLTGKGSRGKKVLFHSDFGGVGGGGGGS